MEPVTRKNCLTCGLCCIPMNSQDAFCNVDEKDLKRLKGRVQGRVVYPTLFQQALGMIDGHSTDMALKTRTMMQTKGLYVGYRICRCKIGRASCRERV